jgi:hypothetical protein
MPFSSMDEFETRPLFSTPGRTLAFALGWWHPVRVLSSVLYQTCPLHDINARLTASNQLFQCNL